MFNDLLASRIYFGTAPVFMFSIAIYVVQTIALVYLFRRLGLLVAIGQAALVDIASYSGYELVFKLSFLVFGAAQVTYFLNYDLYPTALFIGGLGSILAVKDRLNARWFTLTIIAYAVVWVGWLVSGTFPVDMQAFDLNPTEPRVLFNFLTKLLFSLAFVFGSAMTPLTSRMRADRYKKMRNYERSRWSRVRNLLKTRSQQKLQVQP